MAHTTSRPVLRYLAHALTRGHETHVHFEAKRSLRAELTRRLQEAGASPLEEVVRDQDALRDALPETTTEKP